MWGEKTSILGSYPIQIEIIKFRADKFQLSKCNEEFIQDFVLGKVRGKCVGGGHRRAVVRMVD